MVKHLNIGFSIWNIGFLEGEIILKGWNRKLLNIFIFVEFIDHTALYIGLRLYLFVCI